MALEKLQPHSRVAQVAPLVPAIRAARVRGITWNQIVQEVGSTIGIDPGARGAADALRIAYRAAVRQIEAGRLIPASTAPTASPPVQPAVAVKAKPIQPQPVGEHSDRPRFGGFTPIDIDKR